MERTPNMAQVAGDAPESRRKKVMPGCADAAVSKGGKSLIVQSQHEDSSLS